MIRIAGRLALITLLSLALSGCYVFGPQSGSGVVTVAPGQGPPGGPPTPAWPQLTLRLGTHAVPGVAAQYQFSTGSSQGSGSQWNGRWPPPFPGTLAAHVGDVVSLETTQGPPAAMTVVELDGQGVPIGASALMPVGGAFTYPLDRAGHYALQVTAEWDYANFVLVYFDVDVQP